MMKSVSQKIKVFVKNPMHIILGCIILCMIVLLPERLQQFDFITSISFITASENSVDEVSDENPISPLQGVVLSLQEAIKQQALFYVEPTFAEKYAVGGEDLPVVIASGVKVIEDGQKYLNDPGYGSIIITRAEAIKMLTLLQSKRMVVSFDEIVYVDSVLPYDDMRRDSWYVPYVSFAVKQGWLDDFAKQGGSLNPIDVLTYSEMKKLFISLGGASVDITQDESQGYVTKNDFLYYMLESFDETSLWSMRVLWGNNDQFYSTLLQALRGKSEKEQLELIDKTLTTLESVGAEKLFEQYNYDLEGIILLLNEYRN